jgi:hypothetical protein
MSSVKDDRIQLRLDTELKELFKAYASKHNTEMTTILEKHIRQLVKKKGSDAS